MGKDKIILFVIILLTSLMSGLSGSLLAKRLLGTAYIGEYDLSRPGQTSGLSISNPRKVEVLPEQRLNDSAKSSLSSFLFIFKGVGTSSDYALASSLGQAFALTSDGWLISSYAPASDKTATATTPIVAGSYVFIDQQGRRYQADDYMRDNLSGLSFWHVQARDLAVRPFADAASMLPGRALYAQDAFGRAQENSLSFRKRLSAEIMASDPWRETLEVSHAITNIGSPMFDMDGRLVGMSKSAHEIWPIYSLSSCLDCLLSEGRLARPYLGVHYRDLSQVARPEGRFGVGAMLAKSKDVPAVLKSSPAEKAGLREGDIILNWQGRALDSSFSLNEAVASSKVGDKISLQIERADQKLSLDVSLGEWVK